MIMCMQQMIIGRDRHVTGWTSEGPSRPGPGRPLIWRSRPLWAIKWNYVRHLILLRYFRRRLIFGAIRMLIKEKWPWLNWVNSFYCHPPHWLVDLLAPINFSLLISPNGQLLTALELKEFFQDLNFDLSSPFFRIFDLRWPLMTHFC